jgi:hypothetical protein
VIPVAFTPTRSLRFVNTIAIAASVAACISAAMMYASPHWWAWSLMAGIPTFVLGLGWARLLQSRRASRVTRVELGSTYRDAFVVLARHGVIDE